MNPTATTCDNCGTPTTITEEVSAKDQLQRLFNNPRAMEILAQALQGKDPV